MRRTTISAVIGLGILAAATAGPAFAGTSTGNGAQRGALYSAPASTTNPCYPATKSTPSYGFGLLNKTGAPVASSMSTVLGEVHIVDPALANDPTITATLVQYTSNTCVAEDVEKITVNSQGIGNGHLSTENLASGQYFVQINQGTQQVLATTLLTLI